MIAYRSECAVVNALIPHFGRSEEEIRMLLKEITKNDADLIPDNTNKTFTVKLHSLSTLRANNAAHNLCAILNEMETTFPGTDLRMVYKKCNHILREIRSSEVPISRLPWLYHI